MKEKAENAKRERTLILMLIMIEESVRRRNYPPSVREIGSRLGIRSTSTVYRYLRILEERGFITLTPNVCRGISLTKAVGSVE